MDGAHLPGAGLDPKPALLSDKVNASTMHLFAELISKQLAAEEEFAASRVALDSERETAELREQFIAVLGHDLRTPLAAIQTSVDLLALKHAPGDEPASLGRIRRSTQRMAVLVDDVVDFTRGRMGGGIPLELRRDADLAEPLTQVVDELRGLHPERTIDAAIASRLRATCDRERLAQLLSNLLKNALVHGASDRPVRVEAAAAAGVLTVRVTNEGPDLPASIVEQLFKPYWRAGNRRSAHDGLGLGLYIVAEIARSHGGQVSVVSAGGETAFTFTLAGRDCVSIQ